MEAVVASCVHEATTNEGITFENAFLIASRDVQEKCVQLLLGVSVSVDQATNDGITPLLIAVQNDHANCVQK